jgi:hypothetical protein
MTIDLDRLLRETVHELAAEARPVDLTAPALRTARRIRTRRLVSAVASVLVLLVGLGFAAVRLGGTDHSYPPAHINPNPATSTAAPAPTPSEAESLPPGSAPVSVAGGWLIRAAPAELGAIMYDNEQGRYRIVTGPGRVLPSPNGQFVAQVTDNGDVVLKRAADDKEIVHRAASRLDKDTYPVWAPDSSRLAFVLFTGPDTYRLVFLNIDGTELLSGNTVPCPNTCTVKWVDSQRVRVYAGSSRVEVTASTGAVGTPSATSDDPCGNKVAGYHIDNTSWLCVTTTGFAVTAPNGAVTKRVPFPATIDGLGVQGDANGWVLFRPK